MSALKLNIEDFDDIDQEITLNQNLNLKLVLSKISFTELNEIVLKRMKEIGNLIRY